VCDTGVHHYYLLVALFTPTDLAADIHIGRVFSAVNRRQTSCHMWCDVFRRINCSSFFIVFNTN